MENKDILTIATRDIKKRYPGIHKFECQDVEDGITCGYEWETPTRDYMSPSGDCCPVCFSENVSKESWRDDTLKVDLFGNLI